LSSIDRAPRRRAEDEIRTGFDSPPAATGGLAAMFAELEGQQATR
jgi:hypothetical protein